MTKMTRRRKLLLYSGFFIAMYTFFIILALSMRILWVSAPLVIVFAAGIVIPIYSMYHYRHSNKQEKHRMISQKPLYRYYYDRWYTPADSTELDYQIERIKRRKKPL